jgi:hypothetical protein
MIVLGFPVGALAGETIQTAELLRAEILRSVPGHQGSAAQPTQRLPHGRLGQQRLHAFETGLQQCGVDLVQPVADIIVGGNPADSEQGLAVRATLAFLQRSLIGQKRRALHEKHRESRNAEVGNLDIAAAPLSRVGKSRTNGLQAGKKGGQELHPNPESDIC